MVTAYFCHCKQLRDVSDLTSGGICVLFLYFQYPSTRITGQLMYSFTATVLTKQIEIECDTNGVLGHGVTMWGVKPAGSCVSYKGTRMMRFCCVASMQVQCRNSLMVTLWGKSSDGT